MSVTPTHEPATNAGPPDRPRRAWLWLVAAFASFLAIGVAVILLAGSSGPTYAWELNGSFEEEGGGPPARPVSDRPVDDEGFVFASNRGGLGLDVDLGESYTVEMRVRMDGPAPEWIKLIDFKDRWADAGLYVYGGSKLNLVVKIACPAGVDRVLEVTRDAVALRRRFAWARILASDCESVE